MFDLLGIKVTAGFDEKLTTEQLQKQLKKIEKKLQNLELSINLSDKTLKVLNDFSKAMENHKKIAQDLNKVVKEEKIITKGLDGVIKENIKQHLKSGEVIDREIIRINEKTKSTNKVTDAIKKQNAALEKQGQLVKKMTTLHPNGDLKDEAYKYRNDFKDVSLKFDNKGDMSSKKIVENIDQQSKAVEKLQQRLVKLNNAGQVTNSSLARMSTAINVAKTEEELRRIESVLKRIDDSTKAREKTRELERQLELYKKSAEIDAAKLSRTHSKTVDNQALSKWVNDVNKLNASTPNLNHQLKTMSLRLKEIRANAAEAARSSMSMMDQLKTALVRFPIWMASATLFYQPIRIAQDFTRQIIEIDTAMTTLKRVMDAPSDFFPKYLKQAIDLSNELSNRLTDVMKISEGFARMGFKDDELIDITKTAQVLQNISDLDAEGAVDTLTVAMKNYNIEASESLRISDMLNELDNNFPVSTKDLSDGLRRAASTAKTFGVELDELLSMITAISSTTRETGAVIGNGLKTIFSRITTMSEVETILDSVDISIRNINGSIKPVTEILTDLAQKWHSLSDEQRQNIGVTAAGRHQLSRFLALMNNWEIMVEANEFALNSHNSSMKEQIKYNESLEARINRLKNAFTELALTMGDAVITDSLTLSIELMKEFTQATSSVTNAIGVLPGVFGAVGLGTLALSKNFRDFVLEMKFFEKGVNRTEIATRGLKTTLRGLAAASVVGIAFAGIGFVLEKLINYFAEVKEKQRELREETEKLSKTYADHGTEIHGLVARYEEMSKQVEKGNLSKNDEEYLAIQQQIYEILPSVADRIDEKGQAYLRSAEAIKTELEYLEKISSLESKKFVEEFSNSLKEINKQIDDTKAKIDSLHQDPLDRKMGRVELAKMYREGSEPSAEDQIQIMIYQREMAALNEELISSYQKLATEYTNLLGHRNALTQEDHKYIKVLIEEQSELLKTKKGQEELEAQVKTLAGTIAEVRVATGNLFTAEQIEVMKPEQIQLLISLVKELKNGELEWEKYRSTLEDVGFTSDQTAKIIDHLTNGFKENGESVGELIPVYNDLGEIVGYSKEMLEDQVDMLENAANANEALVKSYDDAISNIKSLNGIINDLNENHQVSADKISLLMEKYPDLLAYIGDESTLRQKVQEEIKKEEKIAKLAMLNKLSYNEQFYKAALEANQKQVEMFKRAYGIDLAAYKSLGKAKIAVENRVLAKVAKAWESHTERLIEVTRSSLIGLGNPTGMLINQALISLRDYSTKVTADFDDIFLDQIDLLTGTSLATEGLAKSTDKANKASKANNETLKKSAYYADEYKNAIAALNLELEKLSRLKSKYAPDSKEYGEAIKKEIALQKELLQLHKQQEKSIQNQISSGKFKQTGMVTTEVKSSSSGQYSNTWSGKITSGYGQRWGKMHHGIDIAGNKGSTIDAIIGGEVVFADFGKKGSGYGNYGNTVAIKDSSGKTHVYAHMDSISVKKGDVVGAGHKLGTMGSTGDSTGVHLHYEVRTGGVGQTMNPMEFINMARSGTIPSSSSNKNIGQAQAEFAQSVDQAKSELISLQQEALKTQDAIDALELEYVNHMISKYEKERERVDKSLAKSNLYLAKYTTTSQEYRDELAQQNKHLKYKQNLLADEATYIREQLLRDDLSAKVKQDLREKLSELTLAWGDLNQTIEANNSAIRDSQLEHYAKLRDGVSRSIQKANLLMEEHEDHTKAYREELRMQNKHLEYNGTLLQREAKYLKEQLDNTKLSAVERERLTVKLSDNTLAFLENENAIRQNNKRLEESIRKNRELISEQLVRQQENHLEGLRRKFDELNQTLENLIKPDEIFDVDEFKSSIDEIVYELDRLDGRFTGSPIYKESTGSLRNSLSNTRQEVLNLASSIVQMTEATSDNQDELERMIRSQSQYANELKSQIKVIDELIRKRQLEHKQIEDALQQQIKLKQEQLKQLDEEYEKEDRLKRIREIEEEIEKVKNDTRFEYVQEDGTVIRTYNKGRLKELEKQRDELLKQYERDDIKKAIQDEVDLLQDKLDKTKEIHNNELKEMQLYRNALSTLYNGLIANTREKLNALKDLQNRHLEDTRKNWEDLVSAVRDGTMSFDNLMNSWYGSAIDALRGFGYNVGSEIDEIKRLYRELADLEMPATPSPSQPSQPSNPQNPGSGNNNGGGGSVGHPDVSSGLTPLDQMIRNSNAWAATNDPNERKRLYEANQRIGNWLGFTYKNGVWYNKSGVRAYHDGGIVGQEGNSQPSKLTELANKFFNLKPNEQIVKALKNELFIPEKNIHQNFIPNMRSLFNQFKPTGSVQSFKEEKHYHFDTVVIKADNPHGFLDEFNLFVRSHRK